MTGNGYGASTLGRITTESIATSKVKSSTLPFHISLTRQKKSGIKRSQLKKLRGKPRRQVRLAKTTGLSQLLISLYRTMIEAFIPALVAVATGVAVLFNKVNHRVTVLDSRVDKLELKLVESFTTKADFASAMERMEQHLIRIEDKMDKLVDKKCTT